MLHYMKISLRNFTQIGSEQSKVQMTFHAEGQHIMTAACLSPTFTHTTVMMMMIMMMIKMLIRTEHPDQN
jgi:hypothetical protein